MTSLRVGVVGVGLVSTPHCKGYEAHPAAQVVAVCDLDAERARTFAAQRGIEQVYTDYEGMLTEADLDVVDIATPTFLHAPMSLAAIRAGRHVHCEKPFCRSVAEGLEVRRTAARWGVKLAVGETYVFHTSHVQARRLIEEGAIGRPLQVRQRHGAWLERPRARVYTGPPDRHWRVDPQASGGGDFPWIFDHAVHFFAAAEYFMLDDRVDTIYALRSAAGDGQARGGAAHDPYATAEVDIPIITWTYAAPDRQGVWMRAERLNGKFDVMRGFSTQIIGAEGMIEVLGEGGHNLLWDGRQQHLLLHRPNETTRTWRFDEGGDDVWDSDISYYSRGHMAQVGHLLDCIVEDRAPRYGAEDGLRAVRCTLATILSARQGRPVRVEDVPEDFTAW